MIVTSKKQVLESIGMVIRDDAHSNALKLDSLYQRQRTPSQPQAPVRVDRTDRATVLHKAYLQALKDNHEQE